jgi:glycerol kinase
MESFMKEFVMAIDQGTTSTRCILFDHKGEIAALNQKEHRQLFPKPGWVEHDALEIWTNTLEVISGALDAIKESGHMVAIGITNQRETTVLWDRKSGKPVHNAIVWQDTRTDAICKDLSEESGRERFQSKTGLPLATYFSGPKIKWLLDHQPELRIMAEKGDLLFGNMDTWILWNLTGVHATDVTNASRTQLMNIKTLEWDDEILQILNIPLVMLPEIKSSSEIYGKARGLLSGIPVSGDLGDQQAALFGQTCFSPGDAKNTYGTGCFMLLNTGEIPVYSKNGLLTTVGYKVGKKPAIYALEGSIAITGALVQWLRDNLGMINKSSDIEKLALSVEDNGGIYFVPAFSGLFAPHWKSDARGVITGLTRYVNKGHFARAVLEATAYQTREVLDAMKKDSGITLTSLKVDGGMVINNLLMQFQADILNIPVVRPRVAETTALGSAYAAGLAVGFWEDYEDLRSNWKMEKEWRPAMLEETRKSLYHSWKKAVTRSFDWLE